MSYLLCRIVTALKFLWNHLRDPESQTYYPEQERKSRIQIYLDNFRWMLKYREINHYYYMYGLDRKGNVTQDDYLAKKVFNRLRNKMNDAVWMGGRRANYKCLLQDKFLFGQYLKSLGFPTPQIVALCDNRSITWLDTRQKEPFESLLQRGNMDVFIKELLGECADGIYAVRIEDSKLYLDEREASTEEPKKIIKDRCIIQRRIHQHPEMNRLYPASVNTIRLVTALHNDKVTILAAIIRIGSHGLCWDNLTTGGISVPICIETGKLGKTGMFRPDFGRKVECHPDTGVRFEAFVVPYFAESVRQAILLHRFFYGLHSIGWDIAITEDGPVFVEGNHNWEVPTFQVYDRHFKKKFLSTIPSH